MKHPHLDAVPQRPRWRQAALWLALGTLALLNWLEYGPPGDVTSGADGRAHDSGASAQAETAADLQWPQRHAWQAMRASPIQRHAPLETRQVAVPAPPLPMPVSAMPPLPPVPPPAPMPAPAASPSVVFLGHFQDGGGATAFVLVGGMVQQLKVGDALPTPPGAGDWVVQSVSADQLVLRAAGQQDRVVRAGEGT